MLAVVPPLLDRVLQAVDRDTIVRCLSGVRRLMTGGVGISDNTARTILRLIPGVQLQQGKYAPDSHATLNTLFCSSAVLDPTVGRPHHGRTYPSVPVLCHSD